MKSNISNKAKTVLAIAQLIAVDIKYSSDKKDIVKNWAIHMRIFLEV